MDYVASISAFKVETSHFLAVEGILKDEMLSFLFDTGAAVSLISPNSLFGAGEEESRIRFEQIVKSELAAQRVDAWEKTYKTANNQDVNTYPCVSHGVSIGGSKQMDFYFDFTFDDVNLPLLGTAFSDDCSYSHTINGSLVITGMKDNPGFSFYSGRNVLDFDVVMEKYNE